MSHCFISLSLITNNFTSLCSTLHFFCCTWTYYLTLFSSELIDIILFGFSIQINKNVSCFNSCLVVMNILCVLLKELNELF